MTAHLTVTLETQATLAELRRDVDKDTKHEAMTGLITELRHVMNGTERGYVRIQLASAVASATVTMDQSAAVNDTDDIAIGGSTGGTLSVVETPADEDSFASGSTDTEFADNLVAAINAHSTISKLVWAKRTDTAVVTIYSVVPGTIGNLITLTETGSGMALSAAALGSGAGDEVDGYQFGYDPAG